MGRKNSRTAERTWAGAGVLAATLAVGTAAAQEAAPGSQWLSYNNQLDGQRFSPLKEITPDNVAQLGEVCRIQIDGPTSMHSGLIVADGVIYTATGRETVAIDATTCALRWKYTYLPDEDRASPSTRGVALLDGRLFRGTVDGRLIALDAATGKLLWKSVIAAPRLGESAGAAPLAANGPVMLALAQVFNRNGLHRAALAVGGSRADDNCTLVYAVAFAIALALLLADTASLRFLPRLAYFGLADAFLATLGQANRGE